MLMFRAIVYKKSCTRIYRVDVYLKGGGMTEEGARRKRGSKADERTGGGARERVL